ncbi:MAG: hypothetical protein Q9221_000717 [Calogaya cf. arnoldii]
MPCTPNTQSLASRDFGKRHFASQCLHKSVLTESVEHKRFKAQNGESINVGDTVQLKDGTFLRVMLQKGDVLEGWIFRRNADTLGLSKLDPNEVYWVEPLAIKDSRPAVEQALFEVLRSEVVRRRTMIMSNKVYTGNQKSAGASEDVLFCGWKQVVTTGTAKKESPSEAFSLPAQEIVEASFERLGEDECDDDGNSRIADKALREAWLGIPGRVDANVQTSGVEILPAAIEGLPINDEPRNESITATYTYADVCCGAGGTSRGAEMAGLHLRWALDHNLPACDTYQANSPQVNLYHEELDDLVPIGRPNLRVDIFHGTFPCQAWSLGNTSPNREKGDMNIAASMEIGRCLDIAKPRVVTLEQTSGLVSQGHRAGKHSKSLDRFIKQFTSRNYSVAWKVVNMVEYGLPQFRKRLIMIATCIGEPKLKLPEPTHVEHPGGTDLQPWTSVNNAISLIPRGHPNHEVPPKFEVADQAYDGDVPSPYIVMCRGTMSPHPRGKRAFSLRELTCLQGFPLDHKFAETATKTNIRKQIGNAFPPTMAAVLFDSIKRQLLERDGLIPKVSAEPPEPLSG